MLPSSVFYICNTTSYVRTRCSSSNYVRHRHYSSTNIARSFVQKERRRRERKSPGEKVSWEWHRFRLAVLRSAREKEKKSRDEMSRLKMGKRYLLDRLASSSPPGIEHKGEQDKSDRKKKSMVCGRERY